MDGLVLNLADHIVPFLMFPLCVFLIFTLHELGHYGAARLCGVRVVSFDVGVGPRLWQRRDKRGTVWSVHLMPLCGLVRLAGEAHLTARPGEGAQTPDMFSARPLWQRALIVAAGPAVNLVLAALLLAVFFVFFGVPATRPVVAGAEVGTPAAAAGLLSGDVIVAVDGQEMRREQQIVRYLQGREGKDLNFTIMRNGETGTVTMRPFKGACINARGFDCSRVRIGALIAAQPAKLESVRAVDDIPVPEPLTAKILLGVHNGAEKRIRIAGPHNQSWEYKMFPVLQDENSMYFDFKGRADLFYDRVGVAGALAEAVREAVRLTKGTAYVAVQMWPIDRDRFAMTVQVPRAQGWIAHDMYAVLYIAALISVFVAFFNMLPLPWLDGGALVVLAVEAVTGQERAHTVAPYVARSVILLFLAILAFANAGDFAHVMNLQ